MNTGEPAGKRQRPIRARSTTRASRRGGQQSQSRARSASSKPACPAAFSHKSPRPGVDRPYGQRQTATLRAPFSCPEPRASRPSPGSRWLQPGEATAWRRDPRAACPGTRLAPPIVSSPDSNGKARKGLSAGPCRRVAATRPRPRSALRRTPELLAAPSVRGRHGGSRSRRPAVVAEAKDVDAREGHTFSGRRYFAPRAGVCAAGGPPCGDEIAFPDNEVDTPLEVGKGAAELFGDERLAGATRWRPRRAEIVPNIVVREHLLRKGNIPSTPDLLIKAPSESLVGLDVHSSASYFSTLESRAERDRKPPLHLRWTRPLRWDPRRFVALVMDDG